MITSTISQNKFHRTLKNAAKMTAAAAFWILIWWIAAKITDRELLVASPLSVLNRLAYLITQKYFWTAASVSLIRIIFGFVCGTAVAGAAAIFAAASDIAASLFAPLIVVIKSTPVASFIIMALVWLKTPNVPIFTAALMVIPVIYGAALTAIKSTDIGLLEMAQIYGFTILKKIKLIYIPSIMPQIKNACITAAGLAWKAGIAAEVLCTPKNSIGKYVYESKIYLETTDLFAWTLTIIILSLILEQILKGLLRNNNKYEN